jgi:ATP-binding cassette, subfamily F, member 3
VTTHLDLPTIDGLAIALRRFKGAIVLITHDRSFCRVVIEGGSVRRDKESEEDEDEDLDSVDSEDEEEREEKMKKGKVYRILNGSFKQMKGMDDYVERVTKTLEKQRKLAQGKSN